MRAIVAGYNNMGCEGLEALIRNGFEVVAVFTYTDDPEETIWFSSVAEVAARHNIPVYTPDDINHPLWVEKIREVKPDVIFSFYYRDILSAAILDIPASGCFNLHGSLLPKYRGRVPTNWAIINGETETGVTLHVMTPGIDDGDIVGYIVFRNRCHGIASLLEILKRLVPLLEILILLTQSVVQEDISIRRQCGLSMRCFHHVYHFSGVLRG